MRTLPPAETHREPIWMAATGGDRRSFKSSDENLKHGGPPSRAEAARMLNVSTAAVDRARQVVKTGTKQLQEEGRNG